MRRPEIRRHHALIAGGKLVPAPGLVLAEKCQLLLDHVQQLLPGEQQLLLLVIGKLPKVEGRGKGTLARPAVEGRLMEHHIVRGEHVHPDELRAGGMRIVLGLIAGQGQGIRQGHQYLALRAPPGLHDLWGQPVPVRKLCLFDVLVQRQENMPLYHLLRDGKYGLVVVEVAVIRVHYEQVRPAAAHELGLKMLYHRLAVRPLGGYVLHLYIFGPAEVLHGLQQVPEFHRGRGAGGEPSPAAHVHADTQGPRLFLPTAGKQQDHNERKAEQDCQCAFDVFHRKNLLNLF